MFQKLQKYDMHLIMQELGNFNFKLNVIPKVLEKYMSFSFVNKLIFKERLHFFKCFFR